MSVRLGEDRLELVFYNCVSPAEGMHNLRLKLIRRLTDITVVTAAVPERWAAAQQTS